MLQRLLIKVAKELDKNNISYIVIGGQAVNMHGVVRSTQDIDITLNIDISEIDKLKKIVTKLKLVYVKENADDFAKKFWIMPVYDPRSKIKVDFAFSFSPFEKSAIRRSIEKTIGKSKIKFCSAEDLMIFKIIAGRAIDLYDVRNILLVKDKLDKKYIKRWLKLFEETTNEKYLKRFDKILKSIK